MSGNANFLFTDVAVVSVVACEAPEVITTDSVDERLAGYYERTKVRPGLLRSLAGIRERRQWHEATTFMDAAALAGRTAIEASGIDRARIGLLVDTSAPWVVACRDRARPVVCKRPHTVVSKCAADNPWRGTRADIRPHLDMV